MIGYFHYAVPKGSPAVLPEERPAGNGKPSRREMAMRIFSFLDADGDGKVPVDSVPGRMQEMAKRLDQNSDGVVTKEEIAQAADE